MAAIVKADVINTSSLTQTGSPLPIVFENMNSGMVLAISVIRNSTRTAMSPAQSSIFSGTFNKLRSDTIIRATCTVFGASYEGGNSGVGLCLDENYWDYGVAYQYDGQWTRANQTTIVMGSSQWNATTSSPDSMAIGSHTIQFGCNPAGASDKPFTYLNPNSSDDGRNQQMVSSIVVYEVYP